MRQGADGEHLYLGRLFVITSSWMASASEAVINGFSPIDKERWEGDKYSEMFELGNINDYLLFITMQYVLFGQVISETNTKAVSEAGRTPVYSSLDNKRVNSVIIPSTAR